MGEIDEIFKDMEEWVSESESNREDSERIERGGREEKPAERREEVKPKVKKPEKYQTQMMLGLVGGVILLLSNAIGSIGFYEKVIEVLIQMGLIAEKHASVVSNILFILAMGGGLTVIVGSIILIKIRRLGDWLIGIGAGISLASLLTRVFLLGPTIQYYMSRISEDIAYFFEGLKILGFEIGILGIGVLLSFMATFEEYRWTIILGGTSFASMIAGLTSNPTIFIAIKNALNIPTQYNIYVDSLVTLFLYIGPILLITALLVGAGYKHLSKIVVIICLIATSFTMVSILTDLSNINDYFGIIALLQYMRAGCALSVYAGGIYFIKKA